MPAVRRNVRGEARRRLILDGAMAAIREQAIADVQLASIAAHAGMKPNHVLYYFASRDDVLIAAVADAEQRLATGRSERLRQMLDPEKRLAAYISAYLPADKDDPVWKLWFEGWLRSASRAEFAVVGRHAGRGWRLDLEEAIAYILGPDAPSAGDVSALARRFNFSLDGMAVHVLAGHVSPSEAADMAMAAMRSELGFHAIGRLALD